MNPFERAKRWGSFCAVVPGIVVVFSLALAGCGSAEDAMEDEFGELPQVTPTAQLEFRIDSLTNENRRLHDQLDAATAESRGLAGRVAELETKLAELTAPPPAPAPVPAPVVNGPADMAAYNAAKAQFDGRNYAAAIEQFQGLLSSGAAGNMADNCQYWIGESHYAMRNYVDAIQNFKAVMDFKRSEKIPDAQLMIGNCEAMLGNREAAREAYTAVVTNFPMSPAVDKAKAKLAKMK
jgi:tol-pal system protein YbgF